MLYCGQCKVTVAGTGNKCPLCHCDLSGESTEEPLYPTLQNETSKIYFVFNLMKLAAVFSAVICVIINYITYKHTFWSIFVVAGIACGWLVMAIGIPRKANLIKVMQRELYITCGLAMIWDYFTGWHGWSISFVLPCAVTACMIVIFILSAILKKKPKDYMIYLVLVNILGMLPALFLGLGLVTIKLPSLICIGVSLLFMAGIVLFKRSAAYGEIKKKLHV